jgi:hypothetical protein
MADYTRTDGYYPYIPIDNFRERAKGIVLSSFSYPVTFSTLYTKKIDFAIVRATYESTVGVVRTDTEFTYDNLVQLESRNIKTLAYHQITNNQTYWTKEKAELHALEFYQALLLAYKDLGYEFIPVITVTGITSGFLVQDLYNYLQWFKDEFAVYSDKEIMIRTDYSTFSYGIFDVDYSVARVANLFPKLILNLATSPDYGGSSYPNTAFTKFDAWQNWAMWIYSSTSVSGSAYGLSSTYATTVITESSNIDRLTPQEYSDADIPNVEIYVLNENLAIQSLITNHNLKWQRRLNRIDVLDGYVFDTTPYIAEDNYLLFLDPYRQVYEVFEIKSVEYTNNGKNIYAEYLSTTLINDVVHTTTVSTAQSVDTHIANVLSLTYSTNQIWRYGTKFLTTVNKIVPNLKGKTVLEALNIISGVFNVELVYRPVINNRRIDNTDGNYTGFYIDVYNEVGRNDNKFRIELNNNVMSLTRTTDTKDLITAILPQSSSVSDATWLAYSASAGSGTYTKVAGSRLVTYVPAYDRYKRRILGSTGKNRISYYNGSETTAAALFDNTVLELMSTSKEPKVMYEVGIFNTEIVLGDNISINNTNIIPKIWSEDYDSTDTTDVFYYDKYITISGRVVEVVYQLNDMSNVDIVIDDIIEDFVDNYTK